MLGLGKKIHRHPVRIGTPVANDQDFGRPGHHVDAHLAKQLPFGGRHVDITGTNNLIDRWYGFGAIGQRRDGLCSAHGKHTVDTGKMRRRQHHIA